MVTMTMFNAKININNHVTVPKTTNHILKLYQLTTSHFFSADFASEGSTGGLELKLTIILSTAPYISAITLSF